MRAVTVSQGVKKALAIRFQNHRKKRIEDTVVKPGRPKGIGLVGFFSFIMKLIS